MKIHLHLFTSAEKARTWFGEVVVAEKWVYDRRQRIVFDSNRDAHYGFVAASASELKTCKGMGGDAKRSATSFCNIPTTVGILSL